MLQSASEDGDAVRMGRRGARTRPSPQRPYRSTSGQSSSTQGWPPGLKKEPPLEGHWKERDVLIPQDLGHISPY